MLHQLEQHVQGQMDICRIDFRVMTTASTRQVYTYIAQQVSERLAQPLHVGEAEKEEEAKQNLIRFLSQVIDQRNRKLVLALEELSRLPEESRHSLANVLRWIFDNRRGPYPSLARLLVIVAGGIEMFDLAATEVSALKDICEEMYLPDLEEADAVGLVADGLTSLNQALRDSEAMEFGQRIYAHVEGHPYLTQRLGAKLEGTLRARSMPTSADIDIGIEHLLAGDDLLWHLRRVIGERSLREATETLLHERVRFSLLDEEMHRLCLLGLAKEVDGYWRVRNPFLKRALEAYMHTGQHAEAYEDVASLRRQLATQKENLRLIQERKAAYVHAEHIPLEDIKNERRLEKEIDELKTRIAASTRGSSEQQC